MRRWGFIFCLLVLLAGCVSGPRQDQPKPRPIEPWVGALAKNWLARKPDSNSCGYYHFEQDKARFRFVVTKPNLEGWAWYCENWDTLEKLGCKQIVVGDCLMQPERIEP